MKKFTAIEWCLIILTATIPATLIIIFISKSVTGQAMSETAAALVADLLKIITGGVIGVIGSMSVNKPKQK